MATTAAFSQPSGLTGTDALIEVEGVGKAVGSVQALVDVSLHAQAGRVVGLLGPNGAGKMTLVRILTTLLQPDSGHARVAGLDIVRDAVALRSAIGLAGRAHPGRPAHRPAFVEMCERHDRGALWMLAICTARREAELLGLHWTDVAWECGELRVDGS